MRRSHRTAVAFVPEVGVPGNDTFNAVGQLHERPGGGDHRW
jgi:hypothetical protein